MSEQPTTTTTTPPTPPIPPFMDYQRISLQLSLFTALVMVLSVIACFLLSAANMVPIAIVSGILCLGAILLSLVLTWIRSKKGIVALIRAFMYSQFIRLFLGTIVVLIMVLAIGFKLRVTVVWVLGWYWLLLAAEVFVLQRSVSRAISLNRESESEKSENNLN